MKKKKKRTSRFEIFYSETACPSVCPPVPSMFPIGCNVTPHVTCFLLAHKSIVSCLTFILGGMVHPVNAAFLYAEHTPLVVFHQSDRPRVTRLTSQFYDYLLLVYGVCNIHHSLFSRGRVFTQKPAIVGSIYCIDHSTLSHWKQ